MGAIKHRTGWGLLKQGILNGEKSEVKV